MLATAACLARPEIQVVDFDIIGSAQFLAVLQERGRRRCQPFVNKPAEELKISFPKRSRILVQIVVQHWQHFLSKPETSSIVH
jgi:hypothetical protein